MTFTQRDLVKLQLPLIGALLLLVIAGLLAWWSLLDAQKAEQQRNVAENTKNQIELKSKRSRKGHSFSSSCKRPVSPVRKSAWTGRRCCVTFKARCGFPA